MKSMTFGSQEEAMAKLATVPVADRGALLYEAGDQFTLSGPVEIIDQLEALDAATAILMQTRAAAKRQVNAIRDARIAAGFSHDFGGAAGLRTLDQRSEADLVNWLGLKAIADAMPDGELLSIRDADNETFQATAATVSAAIAAMGVWRAQLLGRSWGLKDEIDAASDEAAVAAIDIEAGWPGD